MISFIIPSYNAAGTIKRAVLSILPEKEIPAGLVEILIIENGSTDETTETAAKLAAQYPGTVRLLHSPKGVSNARNCGIEAAQGEWLFFLDADDRLLPGALDMMATDIQAEKDADLIAYGHAAGKEIRAVTGKRVCYEGTQIEQVRITMIENPTRYMQAWAKLFRAAVVQESGVLFDPQIRLSEDSDFVLRVSRFCRKIVFSEKCVYQYSLDNPSTMRVFDGKKSADFISALNRTKTALETETPAVAAAFDQYVLMNMNVLMVREIFASNNPASRKEQMKQMKQVAKEPVFAEAIGRVKASRSISPRRLPSLMMKWNRYGAAAAIYRMRARKNNR